MLKPPLPIEHNSQPLFKDAGCEPASPCQPERTDPPPPSKPFTFPLSTDEAGNGPANPEETEQKESFFPLH
ncbi:Uncharacterized protein TCM_001092 [Theobroma cacao]|uniref:Uncharacterized protein n=1 Tax=Theobroma cacao TaxID=3641 RepID=A0A061DHZ5_THECC|nr:Uncharacterized protein TCM_001092 [Theobroma cacao]